MWSHKKGKLALAAGKENLEANLFSGSQNSGNWFRKEANGHFDVFTYYFFYIKHLIFTFKFHSALPCVEVYNELRSRAAAPRRSRRTQSIGDFFPHWRGGVGDRGSGVYDFNRCEEVGRKRIEEW